MKSINYIEELNSWRSEFEFSTPIKVRFSKNSIWSCE